MTKQEALDKITRQIMVINELKHGERFSPDFKKWQRDTEIAIQKIFGEDTRHIKDFRSVHYMTQVGINGIPDAIYQKQYIDGLEDAKGILSSFVDEINEYWKGEEIAKPKSQSILNKLELLCERFHLVARQLRTRYSDRNTINIEDEYDVQDLFHSLLTIYFDDIRKEEWTPSYAGSCSRVDFLLKQEEIVVEIKKTRKGLGSRELGEELLVDIQKYQVHPSCKILVCFVYDPEGRIANPRGIENDLNKEIDGFLVRVYIAPRGI
jgi:hypothetical protein